MNRLKVLSALLCLLVVSCAKPVVTVHLVKPTENESIVYLYRPGVLANSMVSPELILNDEKISEIENGTYQVFHLPAKSHILSLNVDEKYLGNKTIELNTQPNQLYFVKLESSLKFQKNKPYIRYLYLKQVSESEAHIELSQLDEEKLSNSASKMQEGDSKAINKDEEAQFSILKTNNPFQK